MKPITTQRNTRLLFPISYICCATAPGLAGATRGVVERLDEDRVELSAGAQQIER